MNDTLLLFHNKDCNVEGTEAKEYDSGHNTLRRSQIWPKLICLPNSSFTIPQPWLKFQLLATLFSFFLLSSTYIALVSFLVIGNPKMLETKFANLFRKKKKVFSGFEHLAYQDLKFCALEVTQVLHRIECVVWVQTVGQFI